jgi:electron transport complex protein RnfG
MKHVKIVLTLSVVVVLFSALVFLAYGITSPIIEARKAAEANAAKVEVLPSLADYTDEVLSSLANYQDEIGETGIIDLFVVPGYGVVYQVEFQGYQSKIEYMLGVDEDGLITGYKTLSQGDTPLLGAEIANEIYWTQFQGMSLETAAAGDFDTITGATVTSTGWKNSIAKVVDFHNNVVLGFEYLDVTADLDTPDTITSVVVVSDGTNDLEVIYTAEFESNYSSSPNIYTVVISLSDGTIKKLTIDEAHDSEGIGALIGESVFSDQFKNMSQQDAIDENFDVQAGASYPITFSAFKASFAEVVLFHRVEFEGYVEPVETEAEKLARWKEELSVEGAIITDVSASYDLSSTAITKVEVASEGAEDVVVIYTFEFEGYADTIEAMLGIDLETDETTGFRVIYENDTDGLGGEIANEEYWEQFVEMNMLAAKYGIIDGLSGATVTTNALKGALEDVVGFHEAEILGTGEVVLPETDGQKLYGFILELYPDAFIVNNVSGSYTLDGDIEYVFEAYDESNNLLGYAFLVNAEGASYSETTFVRFVLAIQEDRTFVGFRMFDDNETPGKADPYYLEDYELQFVGLDIEELEYTIDAVAGSTITHNALMSAVEDVARFYVEDIALDVWARPEPVNASDGILQQAYPSAVTFNSIYLDLPYNEGIANVYEAFDGTGTLIGHVYVATFDGFGANNYFVWGVALDNQTELFTVIVNNEDWDGAPAYLGTETFDTATFLNYYEGINIADILTTPANLDDYAGVSTTTGGLVPVVETIVQFHLDNVDGGGS